MKPEWILRLAAMFLRDYSERLSNDGCNDFDLPEWVPEKELAALIQKHDGGTLDDAMNCTGLNNFIADALADGLYEEHE